MERNRRTTPTIGYAAHDARLLGRPAILHDGFWWPAWPGLGAVCVLRVRLLSLEAPRLLLLFFFSPRVVVMGFANVYSSSNWNLALEAPGQRALRRESQIPPYLLEPQPSPISAASPALTRRRGTPFERRERQLLR